jgi:hypothetical protein
MNTKAKAKVLIATAVIVIAITASAAISVTAVQEPPTSYYIYGWVFYQNTTTCGPGAPCNVTQPTVIITNMNNSKNWTAETNASYNYYELLLNGGVPPEYDVNATEILKFNATNPDGTYQNITGHTVTQGEINQGGLFNFNLTLHMCGDVNCDDKINVLDLIKLREKVADPGTNLGCEWAGNVNCNIDDKINVLDLIKLREKVADPDTTLNCCT